MGPWGFADALVLLSPIAFLVAMVLKPKPMATAKSLWLAAILLFVLKLWYLGASPLEACACFIKGCLQALTPCSIVAGAIFLFDCMESSQCLAWMKVQLRLVINSHPIAEVMLIGFCFAFVVEGASGFGTPAALAAPMLYSMGHPKMECVICLLCFNTCMTIFGAVGTPVWFGIGEVVPDYAEADLLQVGFNAAIALGAAAVAVVPGVVYIIVPWDEVRPSLLFIYMSTLSCVLPLIGLSFVNYEFPTLAAGIVGLCVTTVLTVCGIGLGPHNRNQEDLEDPELGPENVIPQTEQDQKDIHNVEMESMGVEKLEKIPSEKLLENPLANADSKIFDADQWDLMITGKAPTVAMAVEEGQLNTTDSKRTMNGRDAPARDRSNKSVKSFKSVRSVKSVKQMAVNHEVEVCGKTLKKFHKARHMSILPKKIADLLNHDSENSEEPRKRKHKVDIHDGDAEHFAEFRLFDAIFRTMPLWLTVLLLILTRIEPIGLKGALRIKEPKIVDGDLGTLGHLSISPVGRFALSGILGTSIGWTYELLYIPFILPFVVAGCAPLMVFRRELEESPMQILKSVMTRIKGPAIALSGALVLVELLRTSDALKDAPAVIIGTRLSETLSHGFMALSFPLGALGSFFSGSTTVSCLTFTQVQKVAAEKLNLSSHALIALQLCGASSGNAFCLSNIIAATAVIGLHVPEGMIVKRVLKPVFAQFVVCTLVLLPFIYA